MKTVIVVVEGQTEEGFLRDVVYEHFLKLNIKIVPQPWTTNKKVGATGGGQSFDLIENHIRRLIAQHRNNSDIFVSTMIDLYAFPKQGKTIYTPEIEKLNGGLNKCKELEKKLGERINFYRFIPYVQLHEFETFILVQPDALLSYYPDKQREVEEIKLNIAGFEPEEINHTPEGAPSKRIIKAIPIYKKQKTTAGVQVTKKIGLNTLKSMCPHFNDWISRIEKI